MYQSKAEEVGEALIEHIITKYCMPNCIIMDRTVHSCPPLGIIYLINVI